eukprot:TRINITY_DN1783_c0_g1_i2.p1 TRINITY_DN1783_c0_g1~~TRINITY_DN1783_c0_g1_i2.p1  ORF type:complete len:135 (-),score=16.40 TRINITY_DN1783_c0_g1_i2:290-694(-)
MNLGATDEYVVEPVKVYENTYETKPASGEKFEHAAVKRILSQVLEERCKDLKYDPQTCVQLSKGLCDEIQGRVKDLGYRRYKLVVQTVIGENNGQGVRTASRCLWDTENDNFASASFANTSIFAVAMVFGLYYE